LGKEGKEKTRHLYHQLVIQASILQGDISTHDDDIKEELESMLNYVKN